MKINDIVIYAFFIGFFWGMAGTVLVASQDDLVDTFWKRVLVLVFTPVLYLIIGVYIISSLIYWKITGTPTVQDLIFIFKVRFMNYRRGDNHNEAKLQKVFTEFLEHRKTKRFMIPAMIMKKYIDIFMNR